MRKILLGLLATTAFCQLPPNTYQGVHDYSVVTQSPIQTMGAQFTTITDTDFVGSGIPVMRITWDHLCVNTDTSQLHRSWQTYSGGEDFAFSSDSSMFSVISSGSLATVMVINKTTWPANGSVSPISTRSTTGDNQKGCLGIAGQASNHGIGFGAAPGQGQWSGVNPQIMYGGDTTDNIDALNVISGATTVLLSGAVLSANGFLGTGDINEFSKSSDDKFISVLGGASSQDANFLVAQIATGATPWTSGATLLHVLNTKLNTIDGLPYAGPLITTTLHNARMSQDGRYINVGTPGGNSYVWDTVAGTIAQVLFTGAIGTFGGVGHRTWGANDKVVLANSNFSNPIPPNWAFYDGRVPTTFTNVLSPTTPLTTSWQYDSHPSWRNSNTTIPLQPFIISTDITVDPVANPASVLPLGNEVIAVHTIGDQSFDRIVWNRATQDWPGAPQCSSGGSFNCNSRGNVSPDGQWFIFTSNWGQHSCVGTHPSTTGCDLGVDAQGYPRTDVFLVKLPVVSAIRVLFSGQGVIFNQLSIN